MKRSLYNLAIKSVRILAILCVWATFILPCPALADDPSALSLGLYLKKEGDNPVLKYTLGLDAIPVWVVLTNNAAWPLNLDPEVLGGSIDQHLVLIDPAKNKHRVALDSKADDMPQPIRYGGRDLVPVTTMTAGKSKTLKIDDVRAIFPMMKSRAGIYQLQLSMPATIYGWTLPGPGQQPMAVLDEKAKVENLQTKTYQFYIFPERGARLAVRVEDLGMPQERYRDQVPVKIFKTSAIEDEDISTVWDKVTPILSGQTNSSGWANWPLEASCVPEPLENESYTAIAKYQGKFEKVLFEAGDEGWDTECSGRLERHIFFNVPEEDIEFSVFGLNSVWLQYGARIRSGDVGSQDTCLDCLVDGFEIFVDHGAWVADSQKVEGNRVKINSHASVWDVSCNQVQNEGRVRGNIYTPLETPTWSSLPGFPSYFNPSGSIGDDQTVFSGDNLTLTPGESKYRDVTIEQGGILYLDPGTANPGIFHFRNLYLGTHAKVICKGPAEIRIQERIDAEGAKWAYIGPKRESGYSATDVIVYVAAPTDSVVLGDANFVRANVYANGSFATGRGCMLKGAFIAQDVIIGPWSVVKYDSAFSRSEQISLTASKFYIAWFKFVQLTWSGAKSAKVDIYRNGSKITTTLNDGSFYDSLGSRPRGVFTYKICEEGEGSVCSSEESVEY